MSHPPIAELLPHRAPMVLLDGMVAYSEQGATCEVTVRHGMPFVEAGVVPAAVFLEYMAQAVAAYLGRGARARGEAVRAGYLLGARVMDLYVEHAAVGERLEVRAERVWCDEVIGSFRCAVRRGGDALAEATLTVYRGGPGGLAR